MRYQNLEVFAERGGESVVTDAAGRVYVANGQIFVYAADGKEVGRIECRSVHCGSSSVARIGQTLFILHSSCAVLGGDWADKRL